MAAQLCNKHERLGIKQPSNLVSVRNGIEGFLFNPLLYVDVWIYD